MLECLECEEIGAIDHPDFVFKDPTEFYEKDESRRYKSIELFDEDTLDAMTRELDNDQRLVLDIGVNFARSIIKARKEVLRIENRIEIFEMVQKL